MPGKTLTRPHMAIFQAGRNDLFSVTVIAGEMPRVGKAGPLPWRSCGQYRGVRSNRLDTSRSQGMRARISVVTLGVDDLDRSVEFYREGLGLATQGIVGKEFEHGAVAFFELSAGMMLALWPRDSISHDVGISKAPVSPTEFTIGHNVTSRGEVDAVMAEAKQAGAHILKPAHETFWGGYAGCFQDPDQHIWEIVWNPDFLPED